MRRSYRNVALVLGAILFTSNAFSNSSSFTALEVYAAEDTIDSDLIIQSGIESGEENVETEIPADESEPAPTEVEAEDYKENNELTIKEYIVLL